MDKLSKQIISNLENGGDQLFMKIRKEYFYHSYTYRQTHTAVKKGISWLRSRGVNKGDRVLIWGANMPEWTVLYLACILEGVVVVPANILSSAEVVKRYAEQTQPKLIVRSLFQPQIPDTNAEEHILEYFFDISEDLDEQEPRTDLQGSDLLEIMFTSGTTGDPKGVMLSRDNFASQIETIKGLIQVKPGSRLLSLLPYSHIYEQLISLMLGMTYQATIFYVSFLSPGVINKALKEYKITHLALVPEVLQTFLSSIEYKLSQKHLSGVFAFLLKVAKPLPRRWRRVIFFPVLSQLGGKLEMITLGGAKVNTRVQTIFDTMGIHVLEGYGLTETTGPITINTPERNTFGTSGRAIPTVEVKLNDQNEVIIKGAPVFAGYYNRPDLNEAIFDENGYFKTGDIGSFDAAGNLVLKGRQKFRIVLANGEKVYPEDIEFTANQVDGVKDICIFSFEQDHRQDVGAAVILEDPNADLDALISRINERLELTQRIHHATIWTEEDFPRTSTFKVQRNKVKETATEQILSSTKANAATSNNASGQASIEDKKILHIVSLVTGFPKTSLTKDQVLVADLKMDSLKRLTILTLIEEEFSVLIDEDSVDETATLGDLIALATTGTDKTTDLKYPEIFDGAVFAGIRYLLYSLLNIVQGHYIKIQTDDSQVLASIRQPALFIFQHSGHIEGTIIARALRKSLWRKLFYLGRSGLYENPVQAAMMYTMNAYPVKRDGSEIRETMDFVGRMLDKGRILTLAPEGQTIGKGSMGSFHGGISYMAVNSSLPVYLFRIEDVDDLYEGNTDFRKLPKKKGKVKLHCSGPHRFKRYQQVDEITQYLEAEMHKLIPS